MIEVLPAGGHQRYHLHRRRQARPGHRPGFRANNTTPSRRSRCPIPQWRPGPGDPPAAGLGSPPAAGAYDIPHPPGRADLPVAMEPVSADVRWCILGNMLLRLGNSATGVVMGLALPPLGRTRGDVPAYAVGALAASFYSRS